MSVIIPFNLPNDKPVTLFITSNRNVYLEGVLLSGKAVPVPPHGRLGDLDALITTFCEWGTRLERGRKLVITMGEAKQAIVDIIDSAPTIIPAEEDE